MSFPRYPEYKDSGVVWLGEIPDHWIVTTPVKAFEFINGYAFSAEDFAYEGIPIVRMSDIGRGSLELSEAKFVNVEKAPLRFLLRAGDVVLGLSGSIDAVAKVDANDLPCALNQRVAAFRDRSGHSISDWAYWFFQSSIYTDQLLSMLPNTTIVNVGLDDLRSVRLPMPPSEEQAMIAGFLDRETAKIDALVAEQEKLIALLQEKRQALISHAVTKGLNPNVPMKDSGVEWLGEVPGHWAAITLRRCAVAVQTGGTPSADALSESLDEGFVWYTPGDFGSSLKLSTSTRRIANESVASGEAKVFPPKSVLIVSIGATLGKVGFAQDISSANQQINAVIPGARVDGYFLAWSLSVKTEAMRFLSNASTIGIMNQEKTKEIWIALPPPEEQTAIATFLDHETAKLDTLMTEARTAITLLQERRTALISAAVTGQIDVRGATTAC